MKKRLKNIASIKTGVFAKTELHGDAVYLKARHFSENGQLLDEPFPDLAAQSIPQDHFLQPGDVLFAAKGTKNFATVFEGAAHPAVASTSFFVMKLSNAAVLPHYLAWFINQPNTQNMLKDSAIGTSMPSISMAVLANLELPLPTIQQQQLIIQINQLLAQEKYLMQQIGHLREKIVHQQITNALK